MDKDFSSGSLTGHVLLASRSSALPCERAERFGAASYQTRPATGLRSACRRPANASRSPIPTDPSRLSHSSVGPCPQPWTARCHLQDLAVAWRTCPQAVWPPASAQVWIPDTRPATVPADQFSCGHPAAARWPTDMAEPPTVRSAGRPSPMWPPGRRARTPTACERPEADTSSAERPTMRLAS
jgi:hypothetical protein